MSFEGSFELFCIYAPFYKVRAIFTDEERIYDFSWGKDRPKENKLTKLPRKH